MKRICMVNVSCEAMVNAMNVCKEVMYGECV